MTLVRKTQTVFASAAADVGQFGSAQLGTKVISTDPAVIQALSAWTGGWIDAVLGANKFPALEEMNGCLLVCTYQLTYIFQEGIPEYDAGTTYSQYGMCKKPGTFQIYGSLAAANIGNPLTDGAHWQLLIDLSLGSGFSTGDVKPTFKTVADTNWIMMGDGTIGSAASGATYANSAALALFTLLWTNVSNTYAPVSGGRGGSAAADWAANKTLGLPLILGRALAGAGAGSGLTARTLGQTFGDENLQSHNHSINDPTHVHTYAMQQSGADGGPITAASNGRNSSGTTDAASTGITINNAGTGSGGNLQPTVFMNFMIKL